MVDDDIIFQAPRQSANKAEWKDKYLTYRKEAPIYEDNWVVVDNDRKSDGRGEATGRTKVQRKGTKKFGFLKISVTQTLEFNEKGGIQRIAIKKA